MSAPHTDNPAGRVRGGSLLLHLPLLHLVIPGDPRTQGNPQHFQNGGMAYPRSTVRHRAYVASSLATAWAGQPPIAESVILLADFHIGRPASHFGTGRNAGRLKPSAPIFHEQVGDVDKYCRLVMDALTESAVWADDKLAGRVTGEKHWTTPGSGPRTEITILRRDPMDITEGAHALLVKCPECGREVNFPIEVSGRLTVDSLNGGRLKPVVSSKSLEHTCSEESQPGLDFTAEDDE